MLGPWINGGALVLGGAAGTLMCRHLPARVREALPLTCGLISTGIGTVMLGKIHALPAVALSLLAGAFLGELLFLEKRLEQLISWLQGRLAGALPLPEDTPVEHVVRRFVTVLVLFSISGMGIFGALHEGMTGDASILLAKSVLDLFTALIFAAELGAGVAAIALPQITIQCLLYLSAGLLTPLVTPAMQADFSACGGVIMLATGLRICGIKLFPVVNMLPALLLAMPVSSLWQQIVG